MLEPETKSEIAAMVRSGFYDKTQLLEIFTEEMYAPGELDADELAAVIDANFEEYDSEKKTWPDVTDCDRLDAAFDALNERCVIALQNAGYTQSDGYDDINEAYAEHPDQDSVLGYCYYHGQDLERAINGDGLFFSGMSRRLPNWKVGHTVRMQRPVNRCSGVMWSTLPLAGTVIESS